MSRSRTMSGIAVSSLLSIVLGCSEPAVVRRPQQPEQTARIESISHELVEGREQLEGLIAQLNQQLEDVNEWRTRYVSKYGRPPDSRVRLREDYRFVPVEYTSRISRTQKDDAFRQLVSQLLQDATLLNAYAQNNQVNWSLLDEYVSTHPRVLGHGRNGRQLAAFVEGLAISEAQTLDSRLYAVDVIRTQRELRQVAYGLLENQEYTAVQPVLDPIVTRMIDGYPTLWPSLQFVSESEFRTMTQDRNVLAFHQAYNDSIVVRVPSETIDLIIVLAHEYGHVICPSGEEDCLQEIERHEQKIERIGELLCEVNRVLDMTTAYHQNPSNARIEEVHDAFRILTNRLAECNRTEEQLRSLYESLRSHHGGSGVEEACAYLLQEMVAHECARRSRAGGLFIDYSELVAMSGTGIHVGSYLVAKELAAQMGAQAAFNMLAYAGPDRRRVWEQRARELSPAEDANTALDIQQIQAECAVRARSLTLQDTETLQRRIIDELEKFMVYARF